MFEISSELTFKFNTNRKKIKLNCTFKCINYDLAKQNN